MRIPNLTIVRHRVDVVVARVAAVMEAVKAAVAVGMVVATARQPLHVLSPQPLEPVQQQQRQRLLPRRPLHRLLPRHLYRPKNLLLLQMLLRQPPSIKTCRQAAPAAVVQPRLKRARSHDQRLLSLPLSELSSDRGFCWAGRVT